MGNQIHKEGAAAQQNKHTNAAESPGRQLGGNTLGLSGYYENGGDTLNSQFEYSRGLSRTNTKLYIDDPTGEIQREKLNDLELKAEDLKTEILSSVFEGNIKHLKEDIMLTRNRHDLKHYEHAIMVVFWFAIHRENLPIAQMLVKKEYEIKKLVASIQLKELQSAAKLSKQSFGNYTRGGIGTEGAEDRRGHRHEAWKAPNRNSEYDDEVHSSHEFEESEHMEHINMSQTSELQSSEGEDEEYDEYGEQIDKGQDQQYNSLLNRGRQQLQHNQEQYEGGSDEFKEDSHFDSSDESKHSKEEVKEPPVKQVTQQVVSAANPLAALIQAVQEKKSQQQLVKHQNTVSNYFSEMSKERDRDEREDEARKTRESHVYQQTNASYGLTTEQIHNADIKGMEDLLLIKHYLRTDCPITMSKVLRVVMSMGESKIACIITVDYEIVLDDDMLFNAVEQEHFDWLYYLWATRKNYLGSRLDPKPTFITFEQLFDIIIRSFTGKPDDENDKTRRYIKLVLDWRIDSYQDKNNIIKNLLAHHLDQIAVEYMGVYNKLLNEDLLIYCIDHGNNFFLQQALVLAAFDKMLFRKEKVITEILTILKRGYCTNFILNIISLIDISVWKTKHLKSLIEIISEYVTDNYNKNRLILSANPLMSIALACEILVKIAEARRKYESECHQIKQNLLTLGQIYSKKIEDEGYYENIIMSKDFTDRSIIKIITQNNFEQLMDENDPKAERVMIMIWQGKEAAHCDGDIYGYSNFVHIIMSKAKKVTDRNGNTFIQIVKNFFQPNIHINYAFQYRFRIQSIQFYFYKEFMCAALMLAIFQYINYRYLILFAQSNLQPDKFYSSQNGNSTTNDTNSFNITNQSATSTDLLANEERYIILDQLSAVNRSIQEYVNWNTWALLFSSALIFQHMLKIVFNVFSQYKIGIDKWTVMDLLSAILNILAVILIQNIDPNIFLQTKMKDLIDYFMLIVLCVSWLRFFSYFLVVRSISKLLLTLIRMIGDTLSFMFLVSCFILIMSSIFATLYQDTDPEKYGGLAKTVTTLFNGVVAQYTYDDEQMSGRVISHSLLTIFHVFFTNILLMNYLIAILSSTYGRMRESGIFSFKVNLYQYCERFLTAFKDRAYGELVMHPPPLSFFSGILVMFCFNRESMTKVSKCISYFMYWFENIAYIIAFSLFETALLPLAYIKIWYNLISMLKNFDLSTIGRLRSAGYCVIWLFLGPLITLRILSSDVYNFVAILTHHDGFIRTKEEMSEENKSEDFNSKMEIYNEIRCIVISSYLKLLKDREKSNRQQQQQLSGQQSSGLFQQPLEESSSDEDDLGHIPDFFTIDEVMIAQLAFGSADFIIMKDVIREEWEKRRKTAERRQRVKQLDMSSSNDANFNQKRYQMRKSFKRSLKKESEFNTMKNRRQSMHPMHWQKHTLTANQNKKKPGGGLMKDLTTNIQTAMLDKMKAKLDDADKNKDGVDMSDFKIQDEDMTIAENFLAKFIIMPENGQRGMVDIRLMIKALPNKIMGYSVDNIDIFNFRIFQESLHAFQNLEIVKAFEYFDEKNKIRVQNVKKNLMSQREVIDDASSLLEIVKNQMDSQFWQIGINPTIFTNNNDYNALANEALNAVQQIGSEEASSANNGIDRRPSKMGAI